MIPTKAWARGTVAALERQRNGQVVTPAQHRGSLEQENEILRQRLAEARETIRDLEAQLSRIEPDTERLRLISQSEAATLLNVHPSTISRWVKDGKCRTYRVRGRLKPMIDPDTLPHPRTRGRR